MTLQNLRTQYSSEKQAERNQRGEDFQAEVRRSWRLLPNCWRMRVADGEGGTRPADEIVLLQDVNILAEHKRTDGEKFELSMLRVNQQRGLKDFELAVPQRNLGLVFVSFLNDHKGVDECYVFRFRSILAHMYERRVKHVKLQEFRDGVVPCIRLPLLDPVERHYDFREVMECYRSL